MNIVKHFAKIFFATVFFSAASLWANNIVLPNCGSATLAQYQASFAAPSSGCFIGILDYYSFNYKALQNAPAASAIQVGISSTNDGFSFSRADGTPFTAAAGQIVQFEIDYSILIDPAPLISGGKLSGDPPFGNVTITADYCNDSIFFSFQLGCVGAPTDTLSVGTIPPLTLSASITFPNPAQTFQTLGILFTLDGTNGASGFDGLDTGTTVVLAPEPASLCLVMVGLAALGYKLRKRSLFV